MTLIGTSSSSSLLQHCVEGFEITADTVCSSHSLQQEQQQITYAWYIRAAADSIRMVYTSSSR